MYLRDLSLNAVTTARLPLGLQRKDFNLTTHAVQEIFLSFLPKRSFVLDDCSKVNIEFDSEERPNQYYKLGDIGKYTVGGFPFETYFELSATERSQMLLQALESGLLDIASKCGSDIAPILSASAETRACNFERRYRIERMSQQTKSRAFMAHVFRNVFHGGESWQIEVVNKKKEKVHSVWIAEQTDFVHSSYEFNRSAWDGNKFTVLSGYGVEWLRGRASKLLRWNFILSSWKPDSGDFAHGRFRLLSGRI